MSSKKILKFILFGMTMIFVISCSSDDSDPTVNPDPDMMDPCTSITSTYAADIRPIIDLTCALSGCHVAGGSGDGNFESYNGVKAKADNGSLVSRAVTGGTMPPSNSSGPSLTETQKNLIRCWVEDGAQNN